MFTIREPATPEEMDEYYEFRWRILREPWNQPRGSEQDELESTSQHVAAFDRGSRLIGVGRLHASGDQEAQIRYMAVAENARGAGVGRAIVERLEGIAQERGLKRITLHSRENAIGFYQRLGYRVTGPAPTLFDQIKHSAMAKLLLGD